MPIIQFRFILFLQLIPTKVTILSVTCETTQAIGKKITLARALPHEGYDVYESCYLPISVTLRLMKRLKASPFSIPLPNSAKSISWLTIGLPAA